VSIWCASTIVAPQILAELARDLAVFLAADFASVYFRFEDEAHYLKRYKAIYPFCVGPTTHDLKKSLPDLPWVTVFGPPYVLLLGAERIRTAPASVVECLGENHWYLQLSADPVEAQKQPAPYEAIRDAVKQYLGQEHFLDLEVPQAQRKAPPFEWAPTIRNPLLDHLRDKGLLNE
jgi:hypothetical protein